MIIQPLKKNLKKNRSTPSSFKSATDEHALPNSNFRPSTEIRGCRELIRHDRGGVTAAALLPRCGIGGEAMAGADARF